LSNVINTHKEKDFNNYVNELKILFVIDKLRNSPEYLEYKLSYIAEEFGFSSHSKFASVFKSVVGLSPSVFISHLKKDRLESV
jgi:AraC-like DNA-binding protein